MLELRGDRDLAIGPEARGEKVVCEADIADRHGTVPGERAVARVDHYSIGSVE